MVLMLVLVNNRSISEDAFALVSYEISNGHRRCRFELPFRLGPNLVGGSGFGAKAYGDCLESN